MHLKKLELLGFKSFADKTVLNFEPGITAVVGPNGCGKSNIFDSIRWVLGEQSVKAMRGTSMEDVIFNGTDKRPGLGYAEVALTFNNESKILPIEYNEVTVSRRLYRSGDSEYLLNKTRVRLKDVMELFMGTGIGAESYSLIEQGKIDLILSSKPEDRRLIFDEAAGITKYKTKKREALNKLRDTENNLLRVGDIITEVKRQINSIERQADKARRYKEKFEQLKNMESKLSKYELDGLTAKKKEMLELIDRFKENENQYLGKIDESKRKLNDYNAKLEELQNSTNELKTQDLKCDNLIERNEHHIRLNKERIAEMSTQRDRFNEQRAQFKNRISAQEAKIEEFKAQLESLEGLEKQKNDLLAQNNISLEQITATIKEAQELIAKSKLQILDVSSRQAKLKNEIIELTTQTQTRLARKRRLDLEKSKVTEEYSIVKANSDTLSEKINNIQRELRELILDRDTKASDISRLNVQLNDLAGNMKELENEKISLQSQKEFIEELRLKYEDLPGQNKTVFFTDHQPAQDSTGIIAKIKQIENVKSPNDKQILGDTVQNEDIYRLVCEAKYISLDPQQLSMRIDQLAVKIIELREKESSLKEETEYKQRELTQIEESVHQKEIALANEQTHKTNVDGELTKLQEELDLVDVELSELNEKLSELKSKETELTQQSVRVEKENQDLNELISYNQKTISSKIDEREQTTVAIAQLNAEIDSLKDKKNAQCDTVDMLQEALKEDYSELSLLEEADSNSVKKAQDLDNELLSLEDEIQKTKIQKETLSKDLSELYSRNENMISVIKEQTEKSSVLEGELGKIRNDSHGHQMAQQEIAYKEQSIKDRIEQTYKINLDEFQIDPQEQIQKEGLSEQITKLKEKLDTFGTVNLVAIEEYEELKKRYEFLTNQQDDLLTAKDSLAKAITKINRTTRTLFVETFQKIATEFHTYFRMLFGGGDAQLFLINPDDVLESGIEIVARPPGKKLQSISLLSGGEKALAAIALIFAVFKIKPSPFCVLDEIDAALDESNVGRFGQLLKEFIKNSQFIVITHNKRTIFNADIMYGITMEQTGVSKIVSVKFAEQQERPVAVAGAV